MTGTEVSATVGDMERALPTRGDLTLIYLASGAVALLMAAASVAGIVFRTQVYPASEVAAGAGTDGFNLLCGLPILLGAMWLARRGSTAGLLLWPGALLYALYVYAFYVVGVPLGPLFLPHLALAALSAFTLIAVVALIDGPVVRSRLAGAVPARAVGALLAGLAALFIVRDAAVAMSTLASGAAVDPMEHAAWIVDTAVIGPAYLVGGALLWRREALGYATGAGLLLQIGMLLVGLPVGLALGGAMTGTAVDASIVVLIPVGAVPIVLVSFFVRGAAGPRPVVRPGASGSSAPIEEEVEE